MCIRDMSGEAGLKVAVQKAKEMRIKILSTTKSSRGLDCQENGHVLVTPDGGTTEDTNNLINKAKEVF